MAVLSRGGIVRGEMHVLGQDLAEGVGQRHRLRWQALDDVEDALARLFDADHAVIVHGKRRIRDHE